MLFKHLFLFIYFNHLSSGLFYYYFKFKWKAAFIFLLKALKASLKSLVRSMWRNINSKLKMCANRQRLMRIYIASGTNSALPAITQSRITMKARTNDPMCLRLIFWCNCCVHSSQNYYNYKRVSITCRPRQKWQRIQDLATIRGEDHKCIVTTWPITHFAITFSASILKSMRAKRPEETTATVHLRHRGKTLSSPYSHTSIVIVMETAIYMWELKAFFVL